MRALHGCVVTQPCSGQYVQEGEHIKLWGGHRPARTIPSMSYIPSSRTWALLPVRVQELIVPSRVSVAVAAP